MKEIVRFVSIFSDYSNILLIRRTTYTYYIHSHRQDPALVGPGNTFPTFLVPGYRSVVTGHWALHWSVVSTRPQVRLLALWHVMYRGASVPVLAEFLSSFYNIAA